MRQGATKTTVTRTEIGDNRFRYEQDGDVVYAASKVRYQAVSIWKSNDGTMVPAFHKTVQAAYKARSHPGNRYLKRKVEVIEFEGATP